MAEESQKTDPVYVLTGAPDGENSIMLVLDRSEDRIPPVPNAQRHLCLYVGSGYCEAAEQTPMSLRHVTFAFLSQSEAEAKGIILKYMEDNYPRSGHYNYRVDVSPVTDGLIMAAAENMGWSLNMVPMDPFELPPLPPVPKFPEVLDWNGDGVITTLDAQLRTTWLTKASRADFQGCSKIFVTEWLKFVKAMFQWQRMSEMRAALIMAIKVTK